MTAMTCWVVNLAFALYVSTEMKHDIPCLGQSCF
jgi:hypothetical protein